MAKTITMKELFILCKARNVKRITFSSSCMSDAMIGNVKKFEVTFNKMLHSKDLKNVSFIGSGCKLAIQNVQGVLLYDELLEVGVVFDIYTDSSNPQTYEYTFYAS